MATKYFLKRKVSKAYHLYRNTRVAIALFETIEELLEEDEDEKDSDYEEEEWDRHRALHNDVSARRMVDNVDDLADQPGTKERLFEDKMEVTWDKGSSGLVFYTDAQYWKEVENHEEAEDADDWDVDTSEYDNPGTGLFV